jgi:hypothetical protein
MSFSHNFPFSLFIVAWVIPKARHARCVRCLFYMEGLLTIISTSWRQCYIDPLPPHTHMQIMGTSLQIFRKQTQNTKNTQQILMLSNWSLVRCLFYMEGLLTIISVQHILIPDDINYSIYTRDSPWSVSLTWLYIFCFNPVSSILTDRHMVNRMLL